MTKPAQSTIWILLQILLAGGCTMMRTGHGTTAARTDPVHLNRKSSDDVNGTMYATLTNGSIYAGSYFQVIDTSTAEPLQLSRLREHAGGKSEETMKEWVLYVMAWASKLSGYPFPDSLPEVQWKSEIWFSHRACRDYIPCPVFGLYEDRDVVYLREDLTDSAKDHIAVHEFVHYLQHHSGRFDLYSCIDTDRREQEAFRVQSRFIAEARGGFTMFGTLPLPCGGKELQR